MSKVSLAPASGSPSPTTFSALMAGGWNWERVPKGGEHASRWSCHRLTPLGHVRRRSRGGGSPPLRGHGGADVAPSLDSRSRRLHAVSGGFPFRDPPDHARLHRRLLGRASPRNPKWRGIRCRHFLGDGSAVPTRK